MSAHLSIRTLAAGLLVIAVSGVFTVNGASKDAAVAAQAQPLITVDKPTQVEASKAPAPPNSEAGKMPAPQSAGKVPAVQAAATSMPAESAGSVDRALTRLYRIPRTNRAQTATGGPGYVVRPGQRVTGTTPTSPATGKSGQNLQRATDQTLANGQPVPGNGVQPGPAGYAGGPYARGYGGAYTGVHHVPSGKREWVDYRYFDGEPSRYGYGDNSWYGVGDNPEGEYYRFGFTEGYDRGQWDRENSEYRQSVLSHAGIQFSRGLEAFRSGEYRESVKWFKLASDMNRGDPSAMIYSAHALFAVGRYQEGATYLRKAFTLEPRIAMLTYDMRDDYGTVKDFEAQVAALQSAASAAPKNVDRLTMLGYVLNYSGQADRAYAALAKARKLDPNDKVVKTLYEATSPPDVK